MGMHVNDHLVTSRGKVRLFLTLLALFQWLAIMTLVIVTKFFEPIGAATSVLANAPIAIFSIGYLIRPRRLQLFYWSLAIVMLAFGASQIAAHLAFPGPWQFRFFIPAFQLATGAALLLFGPGRAEGSRFDSESSDREYEPA